MIQFFRKIRNNLLTDHKSPLTTGRFSKYLLYAIGEILLVMVGILLALQVNNWNEERKNRNLEKYYLARIIEDLQADIDEMNRVVDRGFGQVSSALQILSEMNVDVGKYVNVLNKDPHNFANAALEQFPLDSAAFDNTKAPFSKHQYRLWAGQTVDLTLSTFNELLNNGKLDVINNLEIRQKVIDHYNQSLNIVDIQNHVTEARESHRSFLKSHNIPVRHNMRFEEFMEELGDNRGYEVILKNYIWGVSFGLNIYRESGLKRTQEMREIIIDYLEEI